MKLNNLLLSASLAVILAIGAVSCTNEMDIPAEPGLAASVNSSIMLQAPDIYAWSGSQSLTASRADDLENGQEVGTTTDQAVVATMHNDEIEVNFSINDVHTNGGAQKYENADLWTKLSIHVRKGIDFRIEIPLPGAYHCASDDFAIFRDHLNWAYGQAPGSFDENGGFYNRSMVCKFPEANATVTLNLKIEETGISVWTYGVTQPLIDYLFETNGDGLNFEIWNYFDSKVVITENGAWESVETDELSDGDLDTFQAFLENSTITFLTGTPSYYINAFGADPDDSSKIRARDCRVNPNPMIYQNPVNVLFEQYPNYCYHLNGTPWNIVWSFFMVDKKSECYEAHTQTPKTPVAVTATKQLPTPAAE